MKRYKNNAEVIHAWAGRHSDDGQNPGQSVFFNGLTIYSYGYHFPMARHVSFNDVLLTYDSYSNTTNKHQHEVWRAVSHKNTIYVHDVNDPLGTSGVAQTIQAAEELLKSAAKRRSKHKAGDEIHSAWQRVENLYEIAAMPDFKLDWKCLPALAKRRLGATRKLIAACKVDLASAMAKMTEKQKAADKRAKAKKERERKAQVAEVEVFLADWLVGIRKDTNGMHRVRDILGTDGLRLSGAGTSVTTTQGLVVPAGDCRRAWPLIQRVYKAQDAKATPVELFDLDADKPRFGNFELSRIERDGTVVVGCHRFKRWMVEHLAKQLEEPQ